MCTIETRNWTFLGFKDVSLFVLSQVCNRQRFPLAAQYTSPSTLVYSKDKTNASSYLTWYKTYQLCARRSKPESKPNLIRARTQVELPTIPDCYDIILGVLWEPLVLHSKWRRCGWQHLQYTPCALVLLEFHPDCCHTNKMDKIKQVHNRWLKGKKQTQYSAKQIIHLMGEYSRVTSLCN